MKRLKLAFLSALPSAIALLLAIVYIVPKHIAGLSGVMPMLHLAPVFIWGVMYPRDTSFLFVALLGLLADVATGLPLGLSGLSYFLFLTLVRTQRKYIYREGFAAMWAYFALLLLGMQLASWGMANFSYGSNAPIGNALLQWLFTCLSYPLLHFILYPLVERMAHVRYRLNHA
jgi:rod shape-determining protein MreD